MLTIVFRESALALHFCSPAKETWVGVYPGVGVSMGEYGIYIHVYYMYVYLYIYDICVYNIYIYMYNIYIYSRASVFTTHLTSGSNCGSVGALCVTCDYSNISG